MPHSRQDKPIPWIHHGSKTAYKDRIHIVRHDVELPSGDRMFYDVEHGDGFAVCVLVKTPENEIVLSHQYRFPLNRWIYDLPGGGAAPDETAEAAAIRECQEEVGIIPKKLTKLVMFYPAPGRGDWPIHVFYCDDFEEGEMTLDDPAEHVQKLLMPVAQFQKLIEKREIIDSSLLIAWYAARDQGFIKV